MRLTLVLCACLLSIAAAGTAADEPAASPEPVYGKVTVEQVLAASPDWKASAESYQPDAASVEYLSAVVSPVSIQIYYGHWCSDSQEHVPTFMQTVELAKNKAVAVEYWSVARRKEGEERPPVNGRKLEAIPTFVVSVDGAEVGMIVETPTESVEKDLVALIKQAEPQLAAKTN